MRTQIVTTPFGIASILLNSFVSEFAGNHNLPTYLRQAPQYGETPNKIYKVLPIKKYDKMVATIRFDFTLSSDASNAHVCKVTVEYHTDATKDEIDNFEYGHNLWLEEDEPTFIVASKPISGKKALEYVGYTTPEVFKALTLY